MKVRLSATLKVSDHHWHSEGIKSRMGSTFSDDWRKAASGLHERGLSLSIEPFTLGKGNVHAGDLSVSCLFMELRKEEEGNLERTRH